MIDLIFNIINLIVLMVVIFIVIKKYIIPGIKASLNKDIQNILDLNSKKDQIVKAQENVKKEVEIQEKKFEQLSKKINQWTQEVESIKEVNKQNHDLSKLKLKQKLKTQSENYFLNKTKEDIKPEVIEMLKGEFKRHFEAKDNVHKFFRQLICHMQKGEKCPENPS